MFNRYMGNYQNRTVTITTVSLIINAVIGIGNLILGVHLLSLWFIANAGYYLLLSAARGQALKKYAAANKVENSRERYNMEFSVFRRSGVFLCLLGISYLLVCLRMYLFGDATVYEGYTVYLVATVAFTKIVFAVHGAITTRNLSNPIVSAIKIINFTDAMVSIVVTQYTLIALEGSSREAANSSSLFGMGCSVLFVVIGIWMLCKKKKYPRAEDGDEEGADLKTTG